VGLWEIASNADVVQSPVDGTLSVVDRPSSFADAAPNGECAGGRFQEVAFRDQGRVFVARIVTLFPATADGKAQLALGDQVLDTLRVEPTRAKPVEEPVTTTTPSFPTITQVPATTEPTFVPTSADEQEIERVFRIWMADQTDSGLDQSVEDPTAVRSPSHEGWGQHTPDDLAQYDGRIESIRVLDADHAEVVYTILHGGQVAFGNRAGSAVKVNGQWKVSTETVCGMLSLGGIRCPA
jgi:hypothetical protein